MAESAGRGGALIFALASGAGRSAVAVLRLSGLGCDSVMRAMCGRLPPPRVASLRRIRDAEGEVLDQAVVLWFPGPASYTGEDCGELHLHGGMAVIAVVSETLTAHGARPADPGEFTRRAFLNGKLDLVAAEAVADLVAAETVRQRRQAISQMEGSLSRVYQDWAARLRDLLAWQEALIDFAEDEVPPDTEAELLSDAARLAVEIGAHLDDGRRGERLRTGLTFVVAGPPNVGKSSLVNRLAGRDIAIVAPTAGTTRDALEVRLDLDGVPVTLVDTAGLRDAEDVVEAEGVARARRHMAAADLVVLVRDGTGARDDSGLAAGTRILHVTNKADLGPTGADGVVVSAKTGQGMTEFWAALCREAVDMVAPDGAPALTRARHRGELLEARRSLEAALTAPQLDLRAEDLRLALRALGRITGAVGVEHVLDAIFGRFCIGK
jgi:tRNA modification GTPase